VGCFVAKEDIKRQKGKRRGGHIPNFWIRCWRQMACSDAACSQITLVILFIFRPDRRRHTALVLDVGHCYRCSVVCLSVCLSVLLSLLYSEQTYVTHVDKVVTLVSLAKTADVDSCGPERGATWRIPLNYLCAAAMRAIATRTVVTC